MSEARPMFEIGPGALLWGGRVLKTGSPVPPALLSQAVPNAAGAWSIPNYEHCTRVVVRTTVVGANDDGAALVKAQQLAKKAQAERDAAQAESGRLGSQVAQLEAQVAQLEDDLGETKKDLANARRQVTRLKKAAEA